MGKTNANEFGIKVGSKIFVKFFRKGQNQNGNWCIVTYEESKKQQDGSYLTLQHYALWVNDTPGIIDNITENCSINIEKISGVNFTNNEFKNKNGQLVKRRVCNIYCDVSIVGNNQNQQTAPQQAEQKPSGQLYTDDDIDDINLPF